MIIKAIKAENYTVFENTTIQFSKGINVFIGENATGKTHMLKLLYSASSSSHAGTDFSNKIVRTMLPDDFKISRLVTRKQGYHQAKVAVIATEENISQDKRLTVLFDKNTKKWDAEVTGKDGWEKSFGNDVSNFIPAKEILSHSYQLSAATSVGNVRFDDTYIDIINSAKIDISMGKNPANRAAMLKKIETMTNGKVVYDAKKDEFYLKQGNSRQEFNLVAEGVKKMGLVWLLAKNGTLESGSVLYWDEPEANIDQSYISVIADLLLELQRRGVQIFLATHNYFLAKYIDIKKTDKDSVSFYSFYKNDDENGVQCEKATDFSLLKNNSIMETYIKIYRDEIGVVLS